MAGVWNPYYITFSQSGKFYSFRVAAAYIEPSYTQTMLGVIELNERRTAPKIEGASIAEERSQKPISFALLISRSWKERVKCYSSRNSYLCITLERVPVITSVIMWTACWTELMAAPRAEATEQFAHVRKHTWHEAPFFQPQLITLAHFHTKGRLGPKCLCFEACPPNRFLYNNIFWPWGAMIFLNICKLLGIKLISFQRCQCLLKREHLTSLSDVTIQNM